MEEYDTETDDWKISKEKMRNRRADCSVVVVGARIQVLGGYDDKELRVLIFYNRIGVDLLFHLLKIQRNTLQQR